MSRCLSAGYLGGGLCVEIGNSISLSIGKFKMVFLVICGTPDVRYTEGRSLHCCQSSVYVGCKTKLFYLYGFSNILYKP